MLIIIDLYEFMKKKSAMQMNEPNDIHKINTLCTFLQHLNGCK